MLRLLTVGYAVGWRTANRVALARSGPLWIVLGDSTGQGIGASRPSHGYVPGLLAQLRSQDDPAWRVVNLSRAGATAAGVVDGQLPLLGRLPSARLVTCAIGINDLLRTRPERIEPDFHRLARHLPPGSLLANIPHGHGAPAVDAVNRLIRDLTLDSGVTTQSEGDDAPPSTLRLVDLWAHTTPQGRATLAPDGLHPSDLGYRAWVDAFCRTLGLTAGPEHTDGIFPLTSRDMRDGR